MSDAASVVRGPTNRMVRSDEARGIFQVSRRANLEVDDRVLREQRQHVVEERHSRVDLRFAGPIDIEFDLNVRLGGFAMLLGGSGLAHGKRNEHSIHP